jgi:hypothetical protein
MNQVEHTLEISEQQIEMEIQREWRFSPQMNGLKAHLDEKIDQSDKIRLDPSPCLYLLCARDCGSY